MKRSRRLLLFFVFLLLSGCSGTQGTYEEREVAVEALTLSEVYGSPPKVAATLTGWTGVCERLETRQRREGKTFYLSVVGIYEGPADAVCPAVAREYEQVVILEPFESGVYTVTAGDERATFTLPSDYGPETVRAGIESVDLLVPESNPVEAVLYINSYYGGCDDVYKDVTQRREGNVFFVDVFVLASEPPEVPPCPPIAIPFTERVTLSVQDLTPGTYKVNVNGVVESFTLP